MGDIGDPRAVGPLAEFIEDSSRSIYSREDAVSALVKIGGAKARTALKKARDNCENDNVRNSIERALKMMDNKQA